MLERRIKNEIPNKTHIMQSCIHLHSNSRMRTMGIWVSYSSCCCTFDRLYFWFYNTSLSFLWEALFNCTNSERSLSILRKIIRVNILWKQWVFHAEINVCYKMSANYRKRPIFSVMDNGQLWKLLQNENTIAIVQKQKSGNFFELLWFKKVSGFSVMLFEEPFCNSQSHFYEKRSIF